jgi:hypothetical protein
MQMNKQSLMQCFAVICLVISACTGGSQYTFQLFTFPDNMPAHQDGWKLKGYLKVTNRKSGSMYQKGIKEVNLKIEDQEENVLLNVNREYNASAIEGRFHWKLKSKLIVTLMDFSHVPSVNDSNKVDSGNILDILTVELDAKKNIFTITNSTREH